ncbi:MAG TPA: GlsB/YeaQ/YmgE family stress response membrane protein [Hyphomicrobiaceae bacterium]|nr:GlsB/YeaQ/YmgE family stress response membrane protein [Hyphomicrobiaceae bacterium]
MSSPYFPLIVMAINGLLAGWLASLLLGGGGLLRNLIVGIIGAIIGGMLVQNGLLNLPFNLGTWGNQIVVSTVGALIVIILGRIIGR